MRHQNSNYCYITPPTTLNVLDGEALSKLLQTNISFFDQVILSVCTTESICQNTTLTSNIIYRDLGGRTHHADEFENQLYQSLQWLSKLEFTLSDADIEDFVEFLIQDGYCVDDWGMDEIQSTFGRYPSNTEPLLIADIIKGKMNSRPSQLIRLNHDQHSLSFHYLRHKVPTVNLPIKHLVVPHTKNTITFMLLKIYLYSKVQQELTQIKRGRYAKLRSIQLDDMYQVCGFIEKMGQRKFQMDLMKKLTRFMDYLIHLKVIASYQLVDNNKIPQRYLKDCTKILFTFS